MSYSTLLVGEQGNGLIPRLAAKIPPTFLVTVIFCPSFHQEMGSISPSLNLG